MENILRASLITLIMFIIHKFRKEKIKDYFYILYFLILFIGFYFIDIIFPKLEGSETSFIPKTIERYNSYEDFVQYQQRTNYWEQLSIIQTSILEKDLTSDQKRKYTDEMNLHKRECLRNLDNIKDACWWAPDMSDRELGRVFWRSFIAAGFCSGSVSTRLLGALASLTLDYGIAVMDYSDYINEQMYWAQYHAEMYEWFKNVLENA
jgi:hypothetical protein